MHRTFVFVFLAAGCSSSTRADSWSGVDRSLWMGDLTEAQYRQHCEWRVPFVNENLDLVDGYVACEGEGDDDNIYLSLDTEVEVCVDDWLERRERRAPGTVEDCEGCFNDMADDPCAFLRGERCRRCDSGE